MMDSSDNEYGEEIIGNRSSSGKSSYVEMNKELGVKKNGFDENHPLYDIAHLDIIDPDVLLKDVFYYLGEDDKTYRKEIDWDAFKYNLECYNRIPGRVKIDKDWQVCALLGWGNELGVVYFDLNDDEKLDKAGQHAGHFLAIHGGHTGKDGKWNPHTIKSISKLNKCKFKSSSFEPSLDKNNPEGTKGFTNTGCSVMGYAAIAGRKNMIKFLDAEIGISPQEFHDNLGNCLLHYFAKGGHGKLIIEFEDGTIYDAEGDPMENEDCAYDIDRENKFGCAPLHELLLNGHLEAFKECAKEFAEDSIQDYGVTEGTKMNFCHLAAASGNLDALKYAMETFKGQRQKKDANGAKLGLLGVRSGSEEVVEYLVKKGHGIDSTDDRNYGAIEYAIEFDKTHIIPWLRRNYELAPKVNIMRCAIENGQTHALDCLFKIFAKSKRFKPDLWVKVESEERGKIYPIQFAKDDHTRKHVATLMIDKLLEKKNPFDTKHKLGEWKKNVRETIKAYADTLKPNSWIPKEDVEKFKKKIKHIDKGNDADKKTTDRLLEAIREEMIRVLAKRAKLDYQRGKLGHFGHKDFVGEYLRYLHACWQCVNPKVNLKDEDKRAPTTKEKAAATANEVKKFASDKAEEFEKKHPEAAGKIKGVLNKVTSIFGKKGEKEDDEALSTNSSSV